MAKAIIAVDLDGTLMRGDSFLMACGAAAGRNIFSFLAQCAAGLAKLKWKIYRTLTARDIERIAWHLPLIDWLKGQKLAGAEIYLVSAAPEYFLEEIRRRVGEGALFDGIIGSTERENRRGAAKAAALVERFGRGNFDYVGNSQADVPVWQVARVAYNVNPSRGLVAWARAAGVELKMLDENKQHPLMEAWDVFKRLLSKKTCRPRSTISTHP